MCLKIFVVVKPKEGLAVGACQSVFWYDNDYIVYFHSDHLGRHQMYKEYVIPKEGLAGPACQSFLG